MAIIRLGIFCKYEGLVAAGASMPEGHTAMKDMQDKK